MIPTLVFALIMVSSTFAATFLSDAVARLPGNQYFTRRVEFACVFEELYGLRAKRIAQARTPSSPPASPRLLLPALSRENLIFRSSGAGTPHALPLLADRDRHHSDCKGAAQTRLRAGLFVRCDAGVNSTWFCRQPCAQGCRRARLATLANAAGMSHRRLSCAGSRRLYCVRESQSCDICATAYAHCGLHHLETAVSSRRGPLVRQYAHYRATLQHDGCHPISRRQVRRNRIAWVPAADACAAPNELSDPR